MTAPQLTTAEVAAIEAQLARYPKGMQDGRYNIYAGSIVDKLLADRRAMAEECRKLREDAERYRWLRADNCPALISVNSRWEQSEQLDAAIDRFLLAAKGGEDGK